jgi:four helix bundle protein
LFLHHARGSLLEVERQLLIANHLGYIGGVESRQLEEQLEQLAKGLNSLINSLKTPRAA